MNQSVSQSVREEKGHECHFCGMTNEEHNDEYGRSLDTHHKLPERLGGSAEMDNLIPVCITCHNHLEKITRQILPRGGDPSYRQFLYGDMDALIVEGGEVRAVESVSTPSDDCEQVKKEYEQAVDRMRRLETLIQDPEFYAEMLAGLTARGEVVTQILGGRVHVTADKDRAEESYQEWGSKKARVSLDVSETDIKREVERVLDDENLMSETIREELPVEQMEGW